jgi:hypothetical protein
MRLKATRTRSRATRLRCHCSCPSTLRCASSSPPCSSRMCDVPHDNQVRVMCRITLSCACGAVRDVLRDAVSFGAKALGASAGGSVSTTSSHLPVWVLKARDGV